MYVFEGELHFDAFGIFTKIAFDCICFCYANASIDSAPDIFSVDKMSLTRMVSQLGLSLTIIFFYR